MCFRGKNVNTDASFGIEGNLKSTIGMSDIVQLVHHSPCKIGNSVEKTSMVFCFALMIGGLHICLQLLFKPAKPLERGVQVDFSAGGCC